MGRPGLELVAARALNLDCGVIGMNLFLGHRFEGKPFLLLFLIYSTGIQRRAQFRLDPMKVSKAGGRCLANGKFFL